MVPGEEIAVAELERGDRSLDIRLGCRESQGAEARNGEILGARTSVVPGAVGVLVVRDQGDRAGDGGQDLLTRAVERLGAARGQIGAEEYGRRARPVAVVAASDLVVDDEHHRSVDGGLLFVVQTFVTDSPRCSVRADRPLHHRQTADRRGAVLVIDVRTAAPVAGRVLLVQEPGYAGFDGVVDVILK